MNKETIKQLVEDYFKLDFSKKLRKREYVEARAIYYKLLRENTRMSLAAIGSSMNRDHATVLHSLRQIEDWLQYDKQIKQDYDTLNNRVIHAIRLNPELFAESTCVEGFYEVEYKKMESKMKVLQQEQDKGYRLLVNKYNYLKCELNKYQPARIATGEFDIV
tara:strand:+ start:475 stop:960 length:486 start_codon:yes stop_codon:yes gene_type:complete